MKTGPISLASRLAAHQPPKKKASPRKVTIKMPAGLTEAARHEWRRVLALLREREVLDALDEPALVDYARCWMRLEEAEQDIARRGVLVKGERGKVKNPSIQIARTYRDSLVRWCKELGFSPWARLKLATPAAKKNDAADPWDELEAM